uniref:Uncharacterized protein n=1 Tax=Haptolina brevifila TaxID=156173 RepID=A0A7S2HPH3_9EUKA|mmetsp:Transcript_5651/g.11824  ORF Transcript_5651/g.11824 Transcript_5651/m.11824 type:complete len:228 (+) Transcript_5651:223-906(+)
MHVRRKRQRTGRRRERSFERLAFEAGVDYVLSMIRLPQHMRARCAEGMGKRGFDISSQDMRLRPAPKPHFLHNIPDEIDAWIRNNIHAKGWDRPRGRPLLVKSDLVGRGGRACRDIEAFTQLSLWAEFFGSCCVGAGAFAGASLLALATRPRYSPSRLTVAPHPRVSPSRPALAPRPRASPSRRIKPRHSARQCALILAFAPRPRSRLTLALRPRLSPSPLALSPIL